MSDSDDRYKCSREGTCEAAFERNIDETVSEGARRDGLYKKDQRWLITKGW